MSYLNKFLLVLVLIPSIVIADSSVSWDDFDKFTDVEAADESKKKFESRFVKSIEKHIDKLTGSLPKGEKLWIKVTDVDLAGRVLPGLAYGGNSPRDYRVIEHHFYPEIKLNFHLSDSSGKVLQKGSVALRDISFLDRFSSRSEQRDSFRYEKKMLTDWFKETFPREVAEK